MLLLKPWGYSKEKAQEQGTRILGKTLQLEAPEELKQEGGHPLLLRLAARFWMTAQPPQPPLNTG